MIFPKIHITFERWKKHKETGVYVSNLGNIRDRAKKKIEPLVDNSGYFAIILDGHKYMVHRLSAECWCKRKNEEDITVDHLNSNKRDNRAINLEWCSMTENHRRADEKFLNSSSDLYTVAERARLKETTPKVIKEISPKFSKEVQQENLELLAERHRYPLTKSDIISAAHTRFGVSPETIYQQAKQKEEYVFRCKGNMPDTIENTTLKAQKKYGLEESLPISYWEQRICAAAIKPGKKFCGTTWYVERKEDAFR